MFSDYMHMYINRIILVMVYMNRSLEGLIFFLASIVCNVGAILIFIINMANDVNDR